jgi:hypothetical protein
MSKRGKTQRERERERVLVESGKGFAYTNM